MPTKRKNEFGLTALQERFCQEYPIDLNATQSYLRAGYSAKKEIAGREAFKLLTKPDIQSRISMLAEERSQRTKITADNVLRQLARIAFADMKNFASWGDGGVVLKHSDHLSEDYTAAIESVQEVPLKGGCKVVKIKLRDALKALEMLSRHLSLFNDKKTIKVQDLGERLMRAKKRLEERNKRRVDNSEESKYN